MRLIALLLREFTLKTFKCNFTNLYILALGENVAKTNRSEVEILVLSAFGCGAFGNPAGKVAGCMKELLGGHGFHAVKICILDDHNSAKNTPDGNYQAFNKI